MDRRRPRSTEDSTRQADLAAREAAGLITYYGRRYPAATAIVLILALVIGLGWYWQQQRRLAQQQEQQARQTQTSPAPAPLPRPAPATEPEQTPTQASSSTPAPVVEGPSEGAVNLLLGNPSNATADPRDSDNYLMVKRHYALSYSNSRGTPNWVSWRVTRADLGDAPRKRQFDPDADLPTGFYRVAHRDYTGSGFDRGHLCPHSDRANSQEASFATFVMSNIVPQAPNVNQGAWAQLEDHTRDQVRTGRNRAYVIAGVVGTGGRGSAAFTSAIAGLHVTVPAECWKVVVAPVLPSTSADELASVTAGSRVITVVMPNDQDTIGPDWTAYRTSAAAVEQKTGCHFFDRLTPDVAEALSQRVDQTPVAPVRGRPPATNGEW